MGLENLVGEILDGKYKIEKELGKGGMGAVYLATHLGTERPVALKVIVPQFMQRMEFVERFRREARAAGRLRHPNVVDVTDFGFAETGDGRVAYLVMEYLDGCTLGEILEEEKKLPLSWTIDILEQVCAAVQEAHQQGIIHRDLKPDNIWLEPDQRGGYTVKVLDFGIAKLEAESPDNLLIEDAMRGVSSNSHDTQAINGAATISDDLQKTTVHDRKNVTAVSEGETLIEGENSKTSAADAGTLLQPLAEISTEAGTAILPPAENEEPEAIGTKILTPAPRQTLENLPETASLTRVGAVLGTPLYMSPEQCRGERLDPRSDIYSLAVIAYQMLGGKTPFDGDFNQVMTGHREVAPPPLAAKKVPGHVKKVIQSGLAKNAGERPPTAQAFASTLRSHSEGVRALMGNAMVLYSENFLKFFTLAFIIYLPMLILFLAQAAVSILMESGMIGENLVLRLSLSLIFSFSGFFSGTILTGIITWLVAQKMAVPMRPLKLRPAFQVLRTRLKTLFATSAFSVIAGGAGLLFCGLGIVLWVCWALVTPVVMMEGLRGRKAFARSYQLVKRKAGTATAIIILSFVLGAAAGIFASLLAKGIIGNSLNTKAAVTEEQKDSAGKENDINIQIGRGEPIFPKPDSNETEAQKRERRVKGTISESIFSLIQIPISIFIGSFFAVVLALFYIKTRQAGGESISDLLEQFEENEQSRKKWQERVRARLIQSGRTPSKSPSAERQSRS